MNVNDVKTAAEDLVKSKIASPLEGVYVKGVYGAELICGFDVVEADEFAGVFVLDSSGKPVVSSRIVEQKVAEIDRLEEILRDAYGEIRRGKNGKALSIIEDWGSDNE